jgi:hypothetical protein
MRIQMNRALPLIVSLLLIAFLAMGPGCNRPNSDVDAGQVKVDSSEKKEKEKEAEAPTRVVTEYMSLVVQSDMDKANELTIDRPGSDSTNKKENTEVPDLKDIDTKNGSGFGRGIGRKFDWASALKHRDYRLQKIVDTKVSNDRAVVEAKLLRGIDESSAQLWEFHLLKKDGDWKIFDIDFHLSKQQL